VTDHTLREHLQSALRPTYQIERELTGGGMSRVFVAEECALGRRVVVKVLPSDLAAAMSIERFRREIQLAAQLQHPHIVPLLTAGEAAGLPYFTMPFVEGESLRGKLAAGELPLQEAVRMLRDIASALEYAHAHGVVHRDVKPDNVLLSGGSPVITDFGVAKALSASTAAEHVTRTTTSHGIALGTPAYMAPEQAAAEPRIDSRADIYAFGCLAYEMLTGQPPFTGRSSSALLAAQVNEKPEYIARRRSTIPPALSQLVMQCLEKSPADRPQHAAEIVHVLDGLTTPSSGLAPAVWGRRPTRTTWVVASVIMLLGVGAVWYLRDRPRAAVVARSIAVLPFVNVGGDTANEIFADGITDDLASALGKISGLRVAARSSAFSFKGKPVDAKEVGNKLVVGALVEGTVRPAGGRLKVTAELVNAADGLSLWADSYERDAKDLFAVQDSITRKIVGALGLSLSDSASSAIARHGTTNLEAHDLYVRARVIMNRFTVLDLQRSLSLFADALRVDSNYALPYTGTADALVNLADDWLAPRDAYPKAKAAAERALSLDPSSAEAHSAVGTVHLWYDWDGVAGERELRQALRLSANYARAHNYLGRLYAVRLQYDSSIAEFREAARLDPLAPRYPAVMAQVQVSANRPDDAIASAHSALQMDPEFAPAHVAIGDALMLKRDYAGALKSYGRAAAGGDAVGKARVGEALAAAGRRSEALAVADSLTRERQRHYVRAELIAGIFARLNDRDRAFRWLDSSYKDRSGELPEVITWRRSMDGIRDDPRWARLVARVNFR
jgi:serine/threonine-protein kinase